MALIWETNGRQYVCHEHPPMPCDFTQAPLTHTVTVFENDGQSREVGAAVSLMDAHALTRSVRVAAE